MTINALPIDRRAVVLAIGFLALPLAAPAPVFADDAPLTVVEGYLAAWNAHDSAAAAAYFAEDVTYYDASTGDPVKGREAAKSEIIDAFLTAVPDASWQMLGTPVVGDDAVAFEWEFSGTNSGDWSDGTPATGVSFTLSGLSIFRIAAGHITYQGDYYDALGFYTQLGLME